VVETLFYVYGNYSYICNTFFIAFPHTLMNSLHHFFTYRADLAFASLLLIWILVAPLNEIYVKIKILILS